MLTQDIIDLLKVGNPFGNRLGSGIERESQLETSADVETCLRPTNPKIHNPPNTDTQYRVLQIVQ